MKIIKFFLTLLLGLLIYGCEKNEEDLIIEIGFLTSETFSIINTHFIINVYGYDPGFTDVPATLISSQEFNSNEVPFSIKLVIPKNAADQIKYITDKNDAEFYISINWDSDNNGQICNGDISIDHNNSSTHILIGKTEVQSIILKSINTIPCE